MSSVVQPYSKALPGSEQCSHQQKLTEVYRDAVEIGGGSLVAVGGYISTLGLIAGTVGTVYLYSPEDFLTTNLTEFLPLLLGLLGGWSLFFIGVYLEWFSPSEKPVYFDRANRKVHYVHTGKRKRFVLFGPTEVEARSVDWDLVDAELHATMGGTPSAVHRVYFIVMNVRASRADPTLVDSFSLPPVEFSGALWEYIRRYMEAGMPPLEAGETPPTKGPRGSKGLDMDAALKWRKQNYWIDWRDFFWKQLLQHLLLPVILVFLFVNRLIVWTAQEVHWPQSIIGALGRPITEADLAADIEHRLRAAGNVGTEATQASAVGAGAARV